MEYGVRVESAAEAVALNDLLHAFKNGDTIGAARAFSDLQACFAPAPTPAAPVEPQ
jgi:hypothetical protein